jgi:hypothetical protein
MGFFLFAAVIISTSGGRDVRDVKEKSGVVVFTVPGDSLECPGGGG